MSNPLEEQGVSTVTELLTLAFSGNAGAVRPFGSSSAVCCPVFSLSQRVSGRADTAALAALTVKDVIVAFSFAVAPTAFNLGADVVVGCVLELFEHSDDGITGMFFNKSATSGAAAP